MRTAGRIGAALTTLAIGAGWALAGPAPAATSAVSLVGIAFAPATITVSVGDTVTWTNNESGQIPHSVTSDTAGLFDSNPNCTGAATSSCMLPGQSFSQTFSTAGSFAYHCRIHANMHGTVVVVAAASASPAPSPSAIPSPAASPVPVAKPTAAPSPTPAASPAAPASSPSPVGAAAGSTSGSGGSSGSQASPAPTLPFTGAHDLFPLSLLAIAFFLLGGAALMMSRLRSARHRA